MFSNALLFAASVSRSFFTPGMVTSTVSLYAAMCMAVGYVSLLLWLLFTSSFGFSTFCSSVSLPPLSTCAR